MAPRFWYRPPGLVLRALGRLAPGRREAWGRQEGRLPVPVISVGSLSVGGTGKTPTVIALAQRLSMKGRRAHVVTRGHGAARLVGERSHRPAEVGDEPLLIAAFAPTWVTDEPLDGIAAAAAGGAEIVILDGDLPGRVAPTAQARLMVEDAVRGFGNGLAWPLGPLKRPLRHGLDLIDLVITIGPETAQKTFRATWGTAVHCPIGSAQLRPLETGIDWEGLDVVAFAGIAAPERFFATLKALGANLLRAQALSDHQDLTPRLMTRLEAEAKARHAQLVTTEKDAVRLPRAFRQKVISLPVRLELDDWSALDALLDQSSPRRASMIDARSS